MESRYRTSSLLLASSLTRLPACSCLLGEPETTDSDVTDRRANSPLVRGRLTPILSIVHWQCNDKRTDNRFYTTNSCPPTPPNGADNGISPCLRLTDGPIKAISVGGQNAVPLLKPTLRSYGDDKDRLAKNGWKERRKKERRPDSSRSYFETLNVLNPLSLPTYMFYK